MSDINEQCADYFRQRLGFQRIMQELLRRYRSFGCAKGRILLENATEEEREALEGFFGKSFSGAIKLRAIDFEAALKHSAFQEAELKTVLERYFGTVISTARQQKEKKADVLAGLLSDMRREIQGMTSRHFSEAMANKQAERGYLLLRRELENNPDTVRENLKLAIWSIDYLDRYRGAPMRLAVLSAQATRNPHALDADGFTGKIFAHMLALRLERPCPQGAEERDILYYDNGILCDSISSTVTQLGLTLRTEAGEHPAFAAFRERKECTTLSLANLVQLTGAESPTGKAYLVENQMVFSQLCDRAADFRSPVICTSGQVQVAVLRLLDLLAASGTTLYYAGDFDGGGLGIALGLLNRYKNLQLWHMTPDDYAACVSDVKLSDNSLAMLKQAEGTALEPLAEIIRTQTHAGYQELLLERMLNDLMN